MNGWNAERRQRQSELIRNWKPWERSTGHEGQQVGHGRHVTHAKAGTRALLRQLARLLRESDGALP
jgi:hypothetical protein